VDELILLALQERATPQQLEELQAWRRAAPDHEARFLETAALLRLTGLHAEIDHSIPVPTVGDILGAQDARVKHRRQGTRWITRVATLAAALVAGITIGRIDFAKQPGQVREAVFHTGSGDMASAELDDGTVVRMAPNTRLRVMLGPGTREVFLEGRAFFAVARDPSRPFRVRTAEGQATVLGTRFEVDTRDDAFRLLVVDGRVAVSRRDQEVELSAGDMGLATRDGPASVTRVPDPEALLGWMGAFVAFESTPLHRVAYELQTRLGIQVEIVDPAIRDRTVTAWFGEEDRDDVLRVICRTVQVQCEQVGAVFRVGTRPAVRESESRPQERLQDPHVP
jgi:transmembrane sensor